MQKTTEKFLLHASEIDWFSQLTSNLLQQMKINPKDILRFRLSIENVMEIWIHELGENTSCTFTSGSKFGRTYILLSAEGKMVNPNEYQDELTSMIDKKLINFGVSIGQIIFMPGVAIQFFIVSLCIGQSFGTEITIVWIITSIITSTILAIATPPIPGGGLSCYTILFAQLGIPSAGIALVISIDLLMDAFLTACNLAFLQTELVLSAKKLNLLDEEKLRK